MTLDIVLAVLLIAQQLFYMHHIQKLVNKLMSRNYGDYEQSKPRPVEKRGESPTQIPEDMSELGIMEQFTLR